MLTYFSYLILSLFLTTSAPVNSSLLKPAGGYKLTVKINGLSDSTCYLGHYYGQHQYVDDTARANSNGEIVFQGNEPMPGGIYFIVLPKKRYFEFIINKEQSFSMETDTLDFIKYMKIKGSDENRLFYEYLNYSNKNQVIYQSLKKRYDNNKANKDSADYLSKELEKIDKKVTDFKLDFIKKYPESFISTIFIASRDPEVPEPPLLPDGKKDSLFQYRYFMKHYWDNIDFTDDKILRTPVFYNRIQSFFNNFVIRHPDSVINEADKLVEKARVNKEFFKYVVWWITYTYETSKIIGFDAVFVHMVEKYYMTDQCFWLSKTLLDNITKRAMKLKPILLGKIAPQMIMQDTNLVLQNLYSVKANYTLVLFWDYECGHCKTEIPKVVDFFNSKKQELGLQVFAVCTDTNMVEMKKTIRKYHMNFINVNGPRAVTPNFSEVYDIYSTPVIYVLDEKKSIVSKRIEIDQVEAVIRNDIKLREMKLK